MESLPLSLAHVLADEDARLYGDGQPHERLWLLRDVEVLDARMLAQNLAQRMGENVPENIARWREESGHDPAYRKRIIDEINALLTSIAPKRWLFQYKAFEDAEEKPYSDLRDAEFFDPDEVFNLNREMFDRLFRNQVGAAADIRFKDLVAGIHERARKGTKRSALALSGGGIRRATYALALIQALTDRPVKATKSTNNLTGGKFALWCLLPLLGAAIALTLAWAWHVSSGGTDIRPALFFGIALFATTGAFFVFLGRFHSELPENGMEGRAWKKRRWMRILSELGESVAAGVTGGVPPKPPAGRERS